MQIIHVLSNQEKLTLMKLMPKGKRNESSGMYQINVLLKFFPLLSNSENREHLKMWGMLQCNRENCEHLKNLRNVYCVLLWPITAKIRACKLPHNYKIILMFLLVVQFSHACLAFLLQHNTPEIFLVFMAFPVWLQYCVVPNHIKVHDTQANLKTTN